MTVIIGPFPMDSFISKNLKLLRSTSVCIGYMVTDYSFQELLRKYINYFTAYRKLYRKLIYFPSLKIMQFLTFFEKKNR